MLATNFYGAPWRLVDVVEEVHINYRGLQFIFDIEKHLLTLWLSKEFIFVLLFLAICFRQIHGSATVKYSLVDRGYDISNINTNFYTPCFYSVQWGLPFINSCPHTKLIPPKPNF